MRQAKRTKSRFKQNLGRSAFFRGKRGELLAALWLSLRGYRILARRCRTPYGEIDIIAKKGGIIAIIEIKSRPDLRQAMDAVSAGQMRRIEAAAEYWRGNQPNGHTFCLRFDLVAICPKKFPRHIKAAWTA